MSMHENDQFQWRETYYVVFEEPRRPKLRDVEQKVASLRGHFQVGEGAADPAGLIESLSVLSPQDYAALEINYLDKDEVAGQVASLYDELKPADGADAPRLAKLKRYTAGFEVMHFELMSEAAADEDDPEDMLDPSALVIVLEALVKMTDGVGLDPQSGALF
jgi:hypothetical protein